MWRKLRWTNWPHKVIKIKPRTLITLEETWGSGQELYGSETSRLALAHRRVDVRKINDGIRTARKSAGELADEVSYKTDHGERAFAIGDRILFTRNDAQLGVKNGMLGIVKHANEGKLEIIIDAVDSQKPPRCLTISVNRYKALDHGYATTIHKSQGATVDNCFVLTSRSMDDHLNYVAMTRHRKRMRMFSSHPPQRVLDRENSYVISSREPVFQHEL